MFFFSFHLSLCLRLLVGVGCWAITFFTWISIWSTGIGSLFVIACKQRNRRERKKSFSLDRCPSTTVYCIRNWDFHSEKIRTKTGTDECSSNRFRVWYSFEIASQIQSIFVPLQHFALMHIILLTKCIRTEKSQENSSYATHTHTNRTPYGSCVCFFSSVWLVSKNLLDNDTKLRLKNENEKRLIRL